MLVKKRIKIKNLDRYTLIMSLVFVKMKWTSLFRKSSARGDQAMISLLKSALDVMQDKIRYSYFYLFSYISCGAQWFNYDVENYYW